MSGHSTEPRFRHVMMLLVTGLAARAGILLAQDVGRLGHPMVAQVHDDQLGRQRFAGVPGRALRLTASALGAGSEVEHPLPGEVFDLAAAEYGILAGILEVDWFAIGFERQQRAQPIRQPFERDVNGRQEDVQVLGMQNEDQERKHDPDVQQQRCGFDDFVGGLPEGAKNRAE
ncbi:Uncharacterised protein [Mycobacterium tuberculosis]|nr:Uncharacterised protein [Mycobacterium tuberculosis]